MPRRHRINLPQQALANKPLCQAVLRE